MVKFWQMLINLACQSNSDIQAKISKFKSTFVNKNVLMRKANALNV